MFQNVIDVDSENRKRIIRISRERILQMKRKNHTQKIINAIGDRRIRDVIDLIALYEQTYDWHYAINCLAESKKLHYESPISTWGQTTLIEPLKYREIVFELFSCSGFEAIPVSTSDILELAAEAESHSSATGLVTQFIIEKTEEHLNMGETLFLNIDGQYNASPKIRNQFIRILNKQISSVNLFYYQGLIDITNLWLTEIGRRTLSDIGVKGYLINPQLFESVLSVLPVSDVSKHHIRVRASHQTYNDRIDEVITAPEYLELLDLVIKQDLEGIMRLGSKYAMPTISFVTKTTLDMYRAKGHPDNFSQMLKCLDCHLAIRHINSISTLEEIISLNDPRLGQISIKALGHYYHESAVNALLEIICTSKNKEYLETAGDAIIQIAKKLPEVIMTLNEFLKSFSCRHSSRIKRLLRTLEKHQY